MTGLFLFVSIFGFSWALAYGALYGEFAVLVIGWVWFIIWLFILL